MGDGVPIPPDDEEEEEEDEEEEEESPNASPSVPGSPAGALQQTLKIPL